MSDPESRAFRRSLTLVLAVLGLLTAGGDGLTNDWGDPLFGTSYDRILFATRPLTIVNAIRSGQASSSIVLPGAGAAAGLTGAMPPGSLGGGKIKLP